MSAIPIKNPIRTRLCPSRHCSIEIGTEPSESSAAYTNRKKRAHPHESEQKPNKNEIKQTSLTLIVWIFRRSDPPSPPLRPPPRRRGRFAAGAKNRQPDGEFCNRLRSREPVFLLRILGCHEPRGPCDSLQRKRPLQRFSRLGLNPGWRRPLVPPNPVCL